MSARQSNSAKDRARKSDTKITLLGDLSTLKKLWPDLKDHKKTLYIGIAAIPLVALLQSALPLILQQTIDRGIMAGNYELLTTGALAYLFAVLAEYVVRAVQSICAAITVHRMIRSLRQRLVAHVLRLKARFHDTSVSGALVTRATSDFDNLSESLNMGILTSVVDISVLIGCLIGMFVLNWQLALIALVILPIVAFIVLWFSKHLKRTMLGARVKIASLNGFTQECFYGSATIKVLTAEKSATKRYDNLNKAYRDAQMKSVVLDASMFSILDGIASITMGLVLYGAIVYVVPTAAISAGIMVAFVQYIQQLFEPLKQLGNKVAMLQGAFTSIDRIFGLLDKRDFIGGTAELHDLKGDLRFDNVSFKYEDHASAKTILKQISFHLPTGRSMAIVGSTGSGKSTIIKLVSRLYENYSGSITLDGVELSDLSPDQLRKSIASVPQDIVLFDGSISFNIGLGLVEDFDRIKAAATAVGANRFIDRLPGGYSYRVREHGQNFSLGQRQLIAFARALVREPGLVILDEATSSIDPESEDLIKEATQKLLKGRSVVIIAHRLSTIRTCDQIVVLERGQVLETGSHAELTAQRGFYYKLQDALEAPQKAVPASSY